MTVSITLTVWPSTTFSTTTGLDNLLDLGDLLSTTTVSITFSIWVIGLSTTTVSTTVDNLCVAASARNSQRAERAADGQVTPASRAASNLTE